MARGLVKEIIQLHMNRANDLRGLEVRPRAELEEAWFASNFPYLNALLDRIGWSRWVDVQDPLRDAHVRRGLALTFVGTALGTVVMCACPEHRQRITDVPSPMFADDGGC